MVLVVVNVCLFLVFADSSSCVLLAEESLDGCYVNVTGLCMSVHGDPPVIWSAVTGNLEKDISWKVIYSPKVE